MSWPGAAMSDRCGDGAELRPLALVVGRGHRDHTRIGGWVLNLVDGVAGPLPPVVV